MGSALKIVNNEAGVFGFRVDRIGNYLSNGRPLLPQLAAGAAVVGQRDIRMLVVLDGKPPDATPPPANVLSYFEG